MKFSQLLSKSGHIFKGQQKFRLKEISANETFVSIVMIITGGSAVGFVQIKNPPDKDWRLTRAMWPTVLCTPCQLELTSDIADNPGRSHMLISLSL